VAVQAATDGPTLVARGLTFEILMGGGHKQQQRRPSRGGVAVALPPRRAVPLLQRRRQRGAISLPSLRPPTSSLLLLCDGAGQQPLDVVGPKRGRSARLECARFGARRVRTGRPVTRCAPRCSLRNMKRILEHAVQFVSQYQSIRMHRSD
jgi:hypothetical protein